METILKAPKISLLRQLSALESSSISKWKKLGQVLEHVHWATQSANRWPKFWGTKRSLAWHTNVEPKTHVAIYIWWRRGLDTLVHGFIIFQSETYSCILWINYNWNDFWHWNHHISKRTPIKMIACPNQRAFQELGNVFLALQISLLNLGGLSETGTWDASVGIYASWWYACCNR